MKIKIIEKSYDEVMKIEPKRYKGVKKPNIFFRTLLKVITLPDFWFGKFKLEKIGLEKWKKKESALILMNHSAFMDGKIISSIFYPRPMNIIVTTDGFVGKNWIMREIGCFPTPKFVSDPGLIRNSAKALKKGSNVVMYPEAGYSFDGTKTIFPKTVAKFVKFLNVPVISVITDGVFLQQPLYNELRKRKVKLSAKAKYLLSPEEIKNMSEDEIYAKILEEFSFDNFRSQQEKGVIVDHPERAVGLNRVLYKCPHCMQEQCMKSKGDTIYCEKCGVEYQLTETGFLKCLNAEGKFDHVPTWNRWQKEEVRKEVLAGNYKLDEDVEICMMIDTYNIYKIGDGHLTHTIDGFHLTGQDGKLDFKVPAMNLYTCNSDYYWYEIADMVSVADYNRQFYCFMKSKKDVVAKTRLATEVIYEIVTNKK